MSSKESVFPRQDTSPLVESVHSLPGSSMVQVSAMIDAYNNSVDISGAGDDPPHPSAINVAANEIYLDDDHDPHPSDPPAPLTDVTMLGPRQKQPRAIFVDWMRSIAVYAVVLVHIFVSIQRVTKVSEEDTNKIEGSFRTVLQFGMPMFFYFSGRSAAFSKRPFVPFLIDKLKRLLMPCVVGFLTVVIPTCYIGRKYRPCAAGDIDDFFVFYGNYFTNQIACNGMDWYWFLPVLLVLSVVDQVPMKWVKDRYPYTATINWSTPRDAGPMLYVCLLTIIFYVAGSFLSIPMVVITLFLAPYWLCCIVVPLMPLVRKYNAIYVIYSMAPAPCLLMAATIQHDYDGPGVFPTMSSQFLMIFFYNFFYLEGFIDSVFDEEWKQWRDSAKMHASLKPLALLGLIIGIGATSPSTRENAGYLYLYPLYKQTPYICFLYVGGTWIWLVILVRYGETFYNDVLNKTEYAHITTSSMLVYLIHWFFIDAAQVLFIQPYNLGIIEGVCILIPVVFTCCGVVYALLYNAPKIGRWVRGGCGCGGTRRAVALPTDMELVSMS